MEFHTNKAVVSQKVIICNEEGRVLLLQRLATDMSRPNGWDFPGGSLEAQEDPITGIQREVQEETGLQIDAVTPISITSFPLHDGCWTILIVYKTKIVGKEVRISNEHQTFRWCTKEEILSSQIPQRYKHMLQLAHNS